MERLSFGGFSKAEIRSSKEDKSIVPSSSEKTKEEHYALYFHHMYELNVVAIRSSKKNLISFNLHLSKLTF